VSLVPCGHESAASSQQPDESETASAAESATAASSSPPDISPTIPAETAATADAVATTNIRELLKTAYAISAAGAA
jgi:hypothetical protein